MKRSIVLNLLFAAVTAALITVFISQANLQWKHVQSDYLKVYAKFHPESNKKPSLGIKQIFVEDAGIVDRCPTCHLGIEDPALVNAQQPFKYHPAEILKNHPVSDYGCTLCHYGEGRATNFADAAHYSCPGEKKTVYLENEYNYRQPHAWENVMTYSYIKESLCGRCHSEAGIFGKGLKGAESLCRGGSLFLNRVCFRCHKVDGIGGTTGPELTGFGDKSVIEFQTTHDLSRISKPPYNRYHMVEWVYNHFKNPRSVFPEHKIVFPDGTQDKILPTIMPDFKFSDEEAEDLTALVLSFKSRNLPQRYLTGIENIKSKTDDPHIIFTYYCAKCHGTMDNKAPNKASIGPTLDKQEFLRIATPEFLRKTISEGRPGRMMIQWKKGIGDLSEKQIDNLVNYLKNFQKVEDKKLPAEEIKGNLEKGELWYLILCANCHGNEGEGKEGQEYAYRPDIDRPPPLSAPALQNQNLLRIVPDSFIKENPLNGRCGMPLVEEIISSFEQTNNRKLPAFVPEEDFDNIAAFIRQWEIKGSIENGKFWYHVVCARCHGVEGRGV
ncbi:MAG: c-type cytochrome, partial [Planctomycetota bacterium]